MMIIIGKKYKNILEKPLSYYKIPVIWLPDNPYVDPRLSGHADLSVFSDGCGKLFAADFLKKSSELDFAEFISENISSKYPEDVKFNVFKSESNVILNIKHTSLRILEYLNSERTNKLIHVNQGYTKCCTLDAGFGSIITSDEGIFYSALKIDQGGIILDGFEYGFIGGAGFRIGDKLFSLACLIYTQILMKLLFF